VIHRKANLFPLSGVLLLLIVLATGCTTPPHARHAPPERAGPPVEPASSATPAGEIVSLDLRAVSTLQGIIPQLAARRVVLVGETHDRYDHHLVQLEIIRRLHALHPRLAIGMEAFQQPFQSLLDDYVAGRISEAELLRGSEYYRRWRFDFRNYKPILDFAREQRLPVVALNLPTELIARVGEVGIEGLTEVERRQLPSEIDRSDSAYEARLHEIYRRHPAVNGHGFENFLDVQLAWDEGMAEQAASYLREHPDTLLVVLAGSGHLAYGDGIPRRLARRIELDSAIVLNGWDGPPEAGLADFLLFPERQTLPPAGKFGALLDQEEEGLTVNLCLADSPCKAAGIKSGDLILSIDGTAISDMTDLRLATWFRKPGDTVTLKIRRNHWFTGEHELTREIELY
jgi:uncharacterized iron-regulated protein